jgi:hypothetical protein
MPNTKIQRLIENAKRHFTINDDQQIAVLSSKATLPPVRASRLKGSNKSPGRIGEASRATKAL